MRQARAPDRLCARSEIGEHEVNEGQEGLGNLPVAPFRNGSMKLPAPSERRVAAPVVGDDGGTWRNGASRKADQRFGLRSGATASRTRPA